MRLCCADHFTGRAESFLKKGKIYRCCSEQGTKLRAHQSNFYKETCQPFKILNLNLKFSQ